MESRRALDLHGILDHGNSDAVRRSVNETFRLAYPGSDFSIVSCAFNRTQDLFSGRFPGYSACRMGYHDYRHTLDVFVAAMRLIDGGGLLGHGLGRESAEDVLIAALLHDCGYIQETGDEEGTGAKYTKTHVLRSAEFIRKFAMDFQMDGERAERVGRIILGTDLGIAWEKGAFSDTEENASAAVLSAADLLGQMADRAYLEKLLFLYYEFKEAGIGGYDTSFDVLRKTASFYKNIAERLDGPLGGVSYDAKEHFAVRYAEDRDLYRESIDRQMSYLETIIRDDSVNFRKRLRRVDLDQVERAETARLKALGVAIAPPAV